MIERPGLFRGFIKRAKALEIVRVACHTTLQAVRRTLCQVGGDAGQGGRDDADRPAGD